ncbi:hypothetical protein C5167_014917 [Papaver somniferum]|uniref:Uncharacterized protein n=1 Tax=Papaver somniferum TaxID=3469 RepID=A0A4Y7J4J3_PAPSO|nr:hypothetical protein C5167_014917 [Papaver somniferum]
MKKQLPEIYQALKFSVLQKLGHPSCGRFTPTRFRHTILAPFMQSAPKDLAADTLKVSKS